MDLSLKRIFPWLLLTAIVVNATGLLTPILEPDGALYAGIAKRIVLTNDWINLYGNGQDWLDKPHFPFWITALSYEIFGINSFAYKFPAFLFWLIGIRFTYLLAKDIYNENVARLTVAVYVIALHGVISNFDVRAEPYLTTLTIASIYYSYRLYKKFSWPVLLASGVFAACAVMTKGIFILLTVAGGLIVYWGVTRQWQQFRSARWWILGLLILIFITPELYCLYVQFDLHPEKVVYGRTGVSGLRFFFWDSQFGRFFNTGPIKGKGDPSFFLHTLLWAFLPWSLLFYYAFVRLLRKKTRVKNPGQWVIYGSAGLSFLLFSLSRFQLPHYIIIFFPQLSMMVADELASTEKVRDQKTLLTIQKILVMLAVAAVTIVSFYGRLPYGYIASGVAILVMTISFIKRKRPFIIEALILSYASAVAVSLFLNLVFYPLILRYEAGMYAAKWLNEKNYTGNVAMLRNYSYAFEFYSKRPVGRIPSAGELYNDAGNMPMIIYTPISNIDSIQNAGYHTSVLQTFEYFHISKLNIHFLDYKTREQQLEKMALVAVGPNPKSQARRKSSNTQIASSKQVPTKKI